MDSTTLDHRKHPATFCCRVGCDKTQTLNRKAVKRLGHHCLRHWSVVGVFSLAFVILCLSLPVTRGTPVIRTKRETDSSSDISDDLDGVNYLLKYAYLPQSDMETGELRSQEELRDSVKAFQRFVHLPETGIFDEATKRMMLAPRCGLPDVKDNTPGGTGARGRSFRRRGRRYVLGPSKWKKRHLTWKLENWSPKLNYGQVRLAVSNAFKLWSDVTYLSFREVARSSPADINIRFARGYHADGYPFDGNGRVLAHAFYPGDDRGGDTHFDEDEPWTLYDQRNRGIDFFTVAAHEFGHALGLAHSHTLRSLMYPIYQGYQPDFNLHQDDVTAIQIHYGVKKPYQPQSTLRPPVSPRYTVVTSPSTTPRVTTTPAPPTPPTMVPTTTEPMWKIGDCNGDFDAISYIRNEYYLFKGKYFWRANKDGLMPGFPLKISQFWYGFPEEMGEDLRIDAVYERPTDYRIVFFIGSKFYLFNGNHLQTHFPKSGRPLSDLGLPDDIERIDASFVWAHNKKTYFISQDMYWKYDEITKTIEQDYPRPMNMWNGVKVPVNTVVTEPNGITYFVKGPMVYEFDNAFMKLADVPPQTTAERYLNCTLNVEASAPSTVDPSLLGGNSMNRPSGKNILLTLFLSIIICLGFRL